MLTVDPKNRITAAEILQHEWIRTKGSSNDLLSAVTLAVNEPVPGMSILLIFKTNIKKKKETIVSLFLSFSFPDSSLIFIFFFSSLTAKRQNSFVAVPTNQKRETKTETNEDEGYVGRLIVRSGSKALTNKLERTHEKEHAHEHEHEHEEHEENTNGDSNEKNNQQKTEQKTEEKVEQKS